MKVYHVYRKQVLPISQQEAWDFFSSPRNLTMITPKKMGFKILYISGDQKMYAGQLIKYKVTVPPGMTIDWMTEITQVNEPFHFIDEQRLGPYSLWHHQHFFREVSGGVEMTDEVNYAIPFAVLGRLANWMFVEREVNAIFDYRYAILEKHFVAKQC